METPWFGLFDEKAFVALVYLVVVLLFSLL